MSIDTNSSAKHIRRIPMKWERKKLRNTRKRLRIPIPYLDDDFAKKSKYGTIIAPPTFAVVFGAHLIEPVFTDKELNLNMAMLVHGEQELEFFEVVKAGDSITTTAKISDIKNKEKLDVISLELNSKNQHGKDVSRGTYTFVVRK